MKLEHKIKLFLVEDDAVYSKLLKLELMVLGDYIIETFPSGESCIENLSNSPDVIILDYHLDGIDKFAMNGIETLDKIKIANPNTTVVMLSSQDKIDIAVKCMHHGAFDYVVKSDTAFVRLNKIILAAHEFKKMEKQIKWYRDHI